MFLALIPFFLSNWKAVLIAGFVAGGLAWLAWERHELILQGEHQAQQEIIDANDKAMALAISAAHTVDACFAAGGTWDRAAGLCLNPAH